MSVAEEQHKNKKYSSHAANYAVALQALLQGFEQEIGRIILFAHTAPRAGPLGLRPRT